MNYFFAQLNYFLTYLIYFVWLFQPYIYFCSSNEQKNSSNEQKKSSNDQKNSSNEQKNCSMNVNWSMASKSSLILEIDCGIQHSWPDFSNIFLYNKNHRIALVLPFKNVVCYLCALTRTGDMKDFAQNKTFSRFYLINWNLNKIRYISSIFESIKTVAHFMEIAEKRFFCDYFFIKNIFKMNAAS